MKLLFRLLLLLSLVQLNEYSIYTDSFESGHPAICSLLWYGENTSLQTGAHFNAPQPAARTANRKLKATFNEEDDDDNNPFHSKKEKEQHSECRFNKGFSTAHSLAVYPGLALSLKNGLPDHKYYYPCSSCRTHVLHQVFRI